MKAIILIFLITASACSPNNATWHDKKANEAPVRRPDLESKLYNAVKLLDHDRGELNANSVTVFEYRDSFAVNLKATLKGDIYFSARLVVDADGQKWEANFGDFCGDHRSKDTELKFRIDKKNVSNAVFTFSGGCGEWLGKGVPGQSNLFYKATDLKFLKGTGKAEQAAASNRYQPPC